MLQYVVENSIVSIYIYRMFIVVGFIFMGLYLQYVLCQQILLYIVQVQMCCYAGGVVFLHRCNDL